MIELENSPIYSVVFIILRNRIITSSTLESSCKKLSSICGCYREYIL